LGLKERRPLNADERAVLEALVHQVGPRLLAYARQVYGKRVDAEDLVAETFCRAADNVETLLGCERRDLYLLTITRNLCRDGFRRRRPELLADDQLPELAGGVDGPEATAAGRECRQALRRAVAALPETQREIVVLRLSGGLTFEEIAELLSIPLGTALSRMHAATRRLRNELGNTYGS
jgi:RNA polymerase sigma-70 factor (ECF subfamily)